MQHSTSYKFVEEKCPDGFVRVEYIDIDGNKITGCVSEECSVPECKEDEELVEFPCEELEEESEEQQEAGEGLEEGESGEEDSRD